MSSRGKDWFIFILGLLAMIKVRYMGTFAVSELIVFAATPFIDKNLFLANPKMRRLLFLAIIWLLGVLVSDVYNQTPIQDALKGAFNVIFLIALIPFSYWLLSDNFRRILYFWGGYAISALVNFFFYFAPTLETRFEFEVWRVYAFWPLFVFLASLLYAWGWKKTGLAVGLGFAYWTLFQSSRNLFLSMTIATGLILYAGRGAKEALADRLQRYQKHRLLLLATSLSALILAGAIYEYGAERGIFGEAVQAKYMLQKNSDIGLASGRVDFVMSLILISENPVFGYGSYAKDKEGFRERYLYDHGYLVHRTEEVDLLPGHSYILGAWVYAGFLGFLFFAFALQQIWTMLREGNVLYEPTLVALFLFLGMQYTWNILFSPFADRFPFLMFLIPVIILNTEYSTENSYDED